MRVEHKWKFSEGDVVASIKHGVGVITSRRLQSRYEMARPIKIVEREIYAIMFGREGNIVSVDGDEISRCNDV